MFNVEHRLGPLDGLTVSMSAPRVPQRLFYAPGHFTANGFLLVGYDSEPEAPWDEQVEYVLDREQSQLRPHGVHEGMEEGSAVYVCERALHVRRPTR
jgi:hypothetical protein